MKPLNLLNPWLLYPGLAVLCILVLLLAFWSMFIQGIPLRISPETTYLTEPLDETGQWVDYFRAIEERLYPPGMKTDDNGVRILVKAVGFIPRSGETPTPEFIKQVYEKLGLDPDIPPTLAFQRPSEFFAQFQKDHPDEYAPLELQVKKKVFEKFLKEIEDTQGRSWYSDEEEKKQRINDLYEKYSLPLELAGTLDAETVDYALFIVPLDEIGPEIDEYIASCDSFAEFPVIQQWVDGLSDVLELFVKVADAPEFMFPLVRESSDQEIIDEHPSVSWIRQTYDLDAIVNYYQMPLWQWDFAFFSNAFRARIIRRVEMENFDGAIDDILTCYRLGQRFENLGIETEDSRPWHVGIRFVQAANGIDLDLSEEQIRRLLYEIEQFPVRPDIEITGDFSRIRILAVLQFLARCYGPHISWSDIQHTVNIYSGGSPDMKVGVNWNTIFKEFNKLIDQKIAGTYTEPLDPALFRRLLTLEPRSVTLATFLFKGINDFYFLSTYESGQFSDMSTQIDCTTNLRRLALAMRLYEKEHGTLPPAFTLDSEGKPLHSWRVLLLRYLGEEAGELAARIRLDEPWDSEYHQQFHSQAPAVLRCPGANGYAVIVGDQAPFQPGTGQKSDGWSKDTLLIVERKDAGNWMDPANDIPLSEAELGINKSLTGIGGSHPVECKSCGALHGDGCNGATLGGSVRSLNDALEVEKLVEMIRVSKQEQQPGA